jgi:glycosyltransferase involved in cell wall biosynthesis
MSQILFVIPSMSAVGGAEKLVITLSSLLQEKYKIGIASFDPIGTAPAFPTTCNFYPLGECSNLPLPLRFISYLNAAKRLFKLKRRLSPSISISLLWRADLINTLTKRKSEKIASLIVINIVNNPTNAMLVRLRLIAGYIYRRFDKILAITPTISDEIKSLYRIKSNKISVFRTFVEPREIPVELAANNCRRFVFCGRAVHEKNIEGLLHAFKLFASKHINRQLLIIGDGPLLPSMITLAKSLGLSVSRDANTNAQVVFVGSINEPEVYMKGAKALLLTSQHEGLPTVLIQAAALSLPILASDCQGGGVQYLLKESLGGAYLPSKTRDLLLPIPDSSHPTTLDAWVRAMELIDSDEEYQYSMKELSSKISQKYSKQSVRAAWLSLIDAISGQ